MLRPYALFNLFWRKTNSDLSNRNILGERTVTRNSHAIIGDGVLPRKVEMVERGAQQRRAVKRRWDKPEQRAEQSSRMKALWALIRKAQAEQNAAAQGSKL
jgi:hypothetical protein